MQQHCTLCQNPIPSDKVRRKARFCSVACRTTHYNGQRGSIGSQLPTGTTGAIGELLVCADLLRKGYEVFRAVSPSCSCDLAVLRDGRLLRVEVRTGYKNKITGKLLINFPKGNAKFDIFAAVVDSEVIYNPPLGKLDGQRLE